MEITLKEIVEMIATMQATPAQTMQSAYIGQVCMVRARSAGVFYGALAAKHGSEVRLENARRVWYWKGAASLSELATRGTSNPLGCKFPAPVASVELTDVIEVIQMTSEAIKSLNGVEAWTA